MIAAGLIIGALRLTFALAPDYSGEIAAALSAASGLQVRLGRIEPRLERLTPVFELTDLELRAPDDNRLLLRLDRARAGVLPFASLAAGAPRLDRLTLRGARLLLTLHPDGRLELAGLAAHRGARAGDGLAALLALPRLRIDRTQLILTRAGSGTEPVAFDDITMEIEHRNGGRRLILSTALDGGNGGRIELRAELDNPRAPPTQWDGRLYLRVDGLQPARLADLVGSPPPAVDGAASLELWGWIERGLPVAGRGNLQLAPGDGGAQRQLRLDWSSDGASWRGLVAGEPSTDAAAIALDFRPGGVERLRVGGEGIVIEALLPWLRPLFADRPLAGVVDGLAPRGRIESLAALIERGPDGVDWHARGQIVGLETRRIDHLPGLARATGGFAAGRDGGRAAVAAAGVELALAPLFRDPLAADRLRGEIGWRRDGDGWRLFSDDLRLDHADLKTRSRLMLRLPSPADPGFLDMQTDFHDGRGANTGRYLPAGIMNPALVRWLDRAIVDARVPHGSFLFRGPLDAFPFKHDEGRFEVVFRAEALELDYLEQWPAIRDADAEVRFLNDGLAIAVERGRILDSAIGAGSVTIASLSTPSPLRVDATFTGPFADGLSVLRDTPLREHLGPFVAAVEGAGEATTQLRLEVPLNGGAPRVTGETEWRDASLEITPWGVPLRNIRGRLAFTEKGLEAHAIQAEGPTGPVEIDLATRRPGAGGTTRLVARFDYPAERLRDDLPQLALPFIEGESAVRLQLDFAHDVHASRAPAVALSTDLLGTALKVPPPLAKARGGELPLTLRTRLGGDGPRRIDLALGATIRAALRVDPATGRLLAGALHFGTDAIDPPAQGLHLSGELERLDLDAWREWQRLTFGEQTAAATLPEAAVDLRVDTLRLLDQELRAVTVITESQPQEYRIDVDADRISGLIRIPRTSAGAPFAAELRRLSLDLRPDAFPHDGIDRGRGLDPRMLPVGGLEVDALEINGHPFGSAAAQLERAHRGLRLTRFEIEGEPLQLTATGGWQRIGDDHHSELEFSAVAPDFGRLLRELALAESLKGGAGEISGQLSWDRSPLGLSLDDLDGNAEVALGKGQVLDVEPGAGRFLGVLSLGALQRRLALDFSDLFHEGLAFDRITGHFRFAAGNAHTDDLTLNGPAIEASIAGRTGLTQRDYDQVVEITPRISANLPVAGAIAGGPAVGAALLVVQQLFGREFDKAAKVRYRVQGPWDEPRFVRDPPKPAPKAANEPGFLD